MNKPYWLVLLIVCIQILVVMILVPGDMADKTIIAENQMMEASLGKRTSDAIRDRANDWHQTIVYDSGMHSGVLDFLIPTEERRKASKGIETMGQFWFDWTKGRVEAISRVIHQFCLRASLVVTWMPFLLILLLPAIYDGLMTWKIKRTNFQYASPVIHRYSLRGILFITVITTLAFFMPVAINPSIIPIILMIACVLLGLSFGNMQKRI